MRALLHGLVDHAALFPPAALAMGPAVRQHARHRAGDAAWMLGRFVVPVARLEEFEAAAFDLLPAAEDAEPWRLSALLAGDPAEELRRVVAFNHRHAPDTPGGRAIIDAVEARTDDAAAIARLGAAVRAARGPGRALEAYAEVPWQALERLADLARAARDAGVRLKLRTGGVTPEAFPPPEAVLAFLVAAREAGVAAKATAGLHHALAGEHPLTYEAGAARGAMYGFVNLFLAAALLHAGHAPEPLRALLGEREATAFTLGDAGLAWRGLRADAAALRAARTHALVAFGSCSFDEPVQELRALGWLPEAPPDDSPAVPGDLPATAGH